MNGELIASYIKENWVWIIAILALVTALITFLLERRKKYERYSKPDDISQKTILKGKQLAVCSGSKLTISGYAASIIGTRKDQQDSYAVVPVGSNEANGLLGIVCDGMGGLAAGKRPAIPAWSHLWSNSKKAEIRRKTMQHVHAQQLIRQMKRLWRYLRSWVMDTEPGLR